LIHILKVMMSTATTHEGMPIWGNYLVRKTIIKYTVILIQHALLTVYFIIHLAPSFG